MRRGAAALAAMPFLVACYQQPPDYPSPGGWVLGTEPITYSPSRPPEADRPPGGPPPPEEYALHLHNVCARTVRLLFEQQQARCEASARARGIGASLAEQESCEREDTIEPNTAVTYTGRLPETAWILDEAESATRRVAHYEIGVAQQDMEIDESCLEFRVAGWSPSPPP